MAAKKVYWINQAGDKVDIDTMSTQYLRNVLKMIVRTNQVESKPLGNIEQNFLEEQYKEWEDEQIEQFEHSKRLNDF